MAIKREKIQPQGIHVSMVDSGTANRAQVRAVTSCSGAVECVGELWVAKRVWAKGPFEDRP